METSTFPTPSLLLRVEWLPRDGEGSQFEFRGWLMYEQAALRMHVTCAPSTNIFVLYGKKHLSALSLVSIVSQLNTKCIALSSSSIFPSDPLCYYYSDVVGIQFSF